MTDRGIIFSGPMVRALWSGRKTQTRRMLWPQPPTDELFAGSSFSLERRVADGIGVYGLDDVDRLPKHPTKWDLCGSVGVARNAGFATTYDARFAVGDRLWVKEALARVDHAWTYAADGAAVPWPARAGIAGLFRETIGARFMRRCCSRMTLSVADVRVERLNAITDDGALAEGVWNTLTPDGRHLWTPPVHPAPMSAPRTFYVELWEVLHGVGSWAANPWVTALTFTTERRNIDAPATREAALA